MSRPRAGLTKTAGTTGNVNAVEEAAILGEFASVPTTAALVPRIRDRTGSLVGATRRPATVGAWGVDEDEVIGGEEMKLNSSNAASSSTTWFVVLAGWDAGRRRAISKARWTPTATATAATRRPESGPSLRFTPIDRTIPPLGTVTGASPATDSTRCATGYRPSDGHNSPKFSEGGQ
jgi:hypothetical protein